ncbi:hypothetical protein CRG98_029754 [Punica granatum]|uniref:Uncharacterized protein n=1 Tax=Punica granatum TaxID=22663 RepID=A0A2I0J1F3_PUNGR|nr:hypothetical protein CRG98_029754 [Punica granatum]
MALYFSLWRGVSCNSSSTFSPHRGSLGHREPTPSQGLSKQLSTLTHAPRRRYNLPILRGWLESESRRPSWLKRAIGPLAHIPREAAESSFGFLELMTASSFSIFIVSHVYTFFRFSQQ